MKFANSSRAVRSSYSELARLFLACNSSAGPISHSTRRAYALRIGFLLGREFRKCVRANCLLEHPSGMPSFRQSETGGGFTLQRRATAEVPPSASMIREHLAVAGGPALPRERWLHLGAIRATFGLCDAGHVGSTVGPKWGHRCRKTDISASTEIIRQSKTLDFIDD